MLLSPWRTIRRLAKGGGRFGEGSFGAELAALTVVRRALAARLNKLLPGVTLFG